ncbi:MAG: hypothetical protein R3246_05125 [Acidimicrobiia bacterium]|nr:hypothetical protein [Acidimicrobiia bacterium]
MSRRYEVMFVLEASDPEELAGRWKALGDEVRLTGGDGRWTCHIHTDHIGPVIESALALGRLSDIEVTDLSAGARFAGPPPEFHPQIEAMVAPVGVVAVAAGAGIVTLFGRLLAQGVVVGSQPMHPTVDELLEIVEDVPATEVIVLPNDRAGVPVAEELDALTTKHVMVVPTRSVPQGVAAMMGYSTGEESLSDAAQTMSAAASSIITAEVTRALRDARVDGLEKIARGEWVGIVDGAPIVSHPDLWVTVTTLMRRILTAPIERVTIYAGWEADAALTDALVEWVDAEYPEAQCDLIDGGQPHSPYLLAFE